MGKASLVIRNAEVRGISGVDIAITDGRIAEIGSNLPPGQDEIDAAGGAVIPGLHDHHCHLFATAARLSSVSLAGARNFDDVAKLIAHSLSDNLGRWIRAIDCPPHLAERLDRDLLDRWAGQQPIRVQDQTGGLWVLNGAALDMVLTDGAPAAVERDISNRPTGRIWRGDDWLGERVGRVAPPLEPIGQLLASFGITGVTDASRAIDHGAAEIFHGAMVSGALPQQLTLMGGADLRLVERGRYRIGPVKILLDERDLMPFDALKEKILAARAVRRPVAIHCVTAVELALSLAALESVGTVSGDRIEHGSIISQPAIGVIRSLGLTVTTQPGFIWSRGDRYLEDVEPTEHADLYRCWSLLQAGIPVAGSSDAPYGDLDCWQAIATAAARRTRNGKRLGGLEMIPARRALALYLGTPEDPGRRIRSTKIGMDADLCLLGVPLDVQLAAPNARNVSATLIGGVRVFEREA